MSACALLVLFLASATASDVTFYFFTTATPSLQIDAKNATEFVKNDVQILIHGWSENRTTLWYQPLTDAILEHGHDVIQVDYGKKAAKSYIEAVRASVQVGNDIGAFVEALVQNGLPLSRIQLIGHSLGGQVAGYAGAHIYATLKQKLPKITALDPAGPFFEGLLNINGKSLSSDDAEIVVVLHTDRNLFGYHGTVGSVDVFPNGGAAIQPGCPERGDNLFCSHHRSYWFYIAAVSQPGSLLASRCTNYRSFMAGNCKTGRVIDIAGEVTEDDKGSYYLSTTGQRPFRSL